MNKKKIGEKTDSLLEAEMIKEAKMIEESLLEMLQMILRFRMRNWMRHISSF